MSIFVKRKKKQPAVLAKYDGHFREPLCRGPRIDYRGNIYDRLRDIQVIAKASLCFPSEFRKSSSMRFTFDRYRNYSLSLSLSLCSFLARAQENERRSNILLRASVRVGIWATIMWTVLARANVYVIEHL